MSRKNVAVVRRVSEAHHRGDFAEGFEAVGPHTAPSMSQENVEVYRRLVEVWNSGDFDHLAAIHHDDVQVDPPEGWPEAEPIEDLDAWIRQARRLMDSWEEQRIEPDEIKAVGERVFAAFRWVAKGKDSSIELETSMAMIVTVRDGMVARLEFHGDRDEARRIAGVDG